MIKRVLVACVVAWAMASGASTAAAGRRITIGLYAPSAPFQGPSDRLQYITRLAEHLSAASDGVEVVGRVFARASDFAAAARKGELQFAVMSAPYGATRPLPFRVLATTTRAQVASSRWLLVAAAGVDNLRDLRGATIAAARTGAREHAFVTNVLLEGEVDANYFHDITPAPDSLSAVTLAKLGRAQAALVPAGVDLPTGFRVVGRTQPIAWPVFVAFRSAPADTIEAFSTRVLSFGEGALPGMAVASEADYAGLRASFTVVRKHGVMATPRPARFAPRDLLAGRRFEIPVFDPLELVAPRTPPKEQTAPQVEPAAPL